MSVCVWTTTLQLSISSSIVISHRASPLCSAIPRSSLGWTTCHFSLQRFSHFFKAKGLGGGWWTEPRLASSLSLPPPHFLFPPSYLCQITWLLAQLGWFCHPAGQWRFPRFYVVFLVFFLISLSHPVSRRRANKMENTPATRHVRQ